MSAVVYHRRAEIAKRIIWAIMILIGLALLALLYSFKTMAQSARKDVRHLEVQIQAEESAINLLKAEIVFLERPDRVAELAGELLTLEPMKYQSGGGLKGVTDIALREDAAREPDYQQEVRP